MSHQKLLLFSVQLESNNWSLKGEHVQPGLDASKKKDRKKHKGIITAETTWLNVTQFIWTPTLEKNVDAEGV